MTPRRLQPWLVVLAFGPPAAAQQAPLPGAEPEALAQPAVSSAPPIEAPAAVEAHGCGLDGEVARVGLQARGARALQVALATRGDDAVALVLLAREGRDARQGLRFTESRLVRLAAAGGAPAVGRAPGFEPDAAVALGADGAVFVASYAPPVEPRGDGAAARPAVQVTVLDASGAVRAVAQAIAGSAGLRIDSPAVAHGAGFAVVLGREPDGGGAVHEALYVVGADGAARGEAATVTAAQSDDGAGARYRVGLGAVAAGEDLALSWTVGAGAEAGVWTRRFDGRALGPASRRVARAAWGSEVAHDGSGVLFRTGGERGAAARLFYAPWHGGEPFALGAGWDPVTAFARGRVFAAGATEATESGAGGAPGEPLVAVSRPGYDTVTLGAPAGTAGSPAQAVDLDVAATRSGALVAWIAAADPDDPAAPRHLAVARVACR